MAALADVIDLVKRFKSYDTDYEGANSHRWGLTGYLKKVLGDGNFTNEEAIVSAKKAIAEGISSLTDYQLRATTIDMLNNGVYMSECPNEWCGEIIAWGDMAIALHEGQCYHCVIRQEKFDAE